MLRDVLAWVERCKSFLRLGEYEVTVELDPNLEQLGLCVADPTYQVANMWIRDPSAGDHGDWRRTVLHELVHVRMGGALGTEPGTEERSALERGVEMMTRVLYKMMMAGAPERALAGAASLCARTIETAREGNERSDQMENGARIAEIAMQLGGMELPEDAKPLVTELISLAAGGGGEVVDPVVPEKDAPPDPMMAADPEGEKMYRKILGDKQVDAIKANAAKIARAQTITLARAELGDRLTPADEAEIAKMPPGEAAAYIKGLKRSTARQAPNGGGSQYRQPAGAEGNQKVDLRAFLKPGEDFAKLELTGVLETRAALARKPAALPRGN